MELQFDTFEEKFKSSVKAVLPKIGLTVLKQEQNRALFHLISGKDVFVSLPTGYGKSVIYQLAPLIVEEMARLDGDTRSAIVLVISPLVSLIKDQVRHLKQKGINASLIGPEQDTGDRRKILKGEMNIVYSSPEAMLANNEWREVVSSSIYQRNVVAVAVDEAHCITYW